MKDKEFSYFDRFLIKLFICFIMLLSVVILDHYEVIEYDELKVELSERFNILKVVEMVNGEDNIFIPIEIDKTAQVDSSTYEEIEYIENGVKLSLGNYEAVESVKVGVVVKIYRNDDNTYNITVKGADDFEYTYCKLTTIDVNIYSLVEAKSIIGKASVSNGKNYFYLYVTKDGKYVDFY